MGVCCIVFDIDGMLFEFFMNFLNIEKNKILRILIFFSKFHVSSRFMLFPTLKKKNWCQKKIGGGGVFAAPKARDGRYCNAPRPSVCPSVRLSVTFSFRTVTQKRIAVFSRNFAGTCTKSWGCAV